MKLRIALLATSLFLSTAVMAGSPVELGNSSVNTDPQAKKCWSATRYVINKRGDAQEVQRVTQSGERIIHLTFSFTNGFGVNREGRTDCYFKDPEEWIRGNALLSGIEINGYRYFDNELFIIDVMAGL